jgi:RluA family pseudouridine synthase
LNKNAWMNVHAWDHKTKETNVIVQVHDYLWDKLNSLTFKPSLIHRIDRDTSGILMIGKKKDMLTKLVNDFKSHEKVKKTYYAIVLWKLSRKEWTIAKKLLRIEWAQNENKVQVSEKWQTAVSHYKLLKEHCVRAPEWDIIFSEIEVQIETGRMHQIRVHMASIGNPIIWDKAYGDKKINSYLERNFWLRRQALHAWKIEFFHYGRQKKMKLEARVKKDLVDFIWNISSKNKRR